tara:strand:- start:3386 stop:4600 length:1215 start_codon:yes stop_codon:yes gene_type:complete
MFNNYFSGSYEYILRLYLIVSCLIVFGLITLYSISNDPTSLNSTFFRQILFIFFSFFVFLVIQQINVKTVHDYSTLIYIGSFFLCFIPFFLTPVENTFRWIDLGFFYIQPGEYLKCATIILIAKYLSDHQLEVKESYIVIIPLSIAVLSAFLVLNQPDLGTAVIIFAPVLPMLLWAGVNTFIIFLLIAPLMTVIAASNFMIFNIWAIIMFIIFMIFQGSLIKRIFLYFANIFTGLLFPFFWNDFLNGYQRQRFLDFLNPDLDPMGSSYHIIQSITAIGSGGLFGKGWGQGSQTQLKFLPVQESDFILSVIAEEFGFIGIVIIMILFFMLIKTLLDLAFKATDYFSSLVIIGLTSILFSHIFVNSAMTIGLMPVKGLPTPFVSAGGSFMLLCFIILALVSSLSKN